MARSLYQGMRPGYAQHALPDVAFVAGVQRSGTNMLMDELLVTDPAQEFRRIFAFLGLPYRPWHNRKVVPHSIRKARQPEVEVPIWELCV